MIVRWGIGELDDLLGELGIERPLLITTQRFAELELPVAARFSGVQRHSPIEVVAAATAAADHADGLVGLGGGSAIDTSKAVSATTALPLVAVPTTYAGAEWTPFFGMRDAARRRKTGGSGAHTVGVVYEPALTLGLPREETVGTALNALAHCAEALYAGECADASRGAELIARWLPDVVPDGDDLDARAGLLEGAMYAGMALAERGMFLAHAMAQALGGRYGVAHGAMNAICLAPALRFNEPVVPAAIASFGKSLGTEDPAVRVEELAQLGGFARLRDFGVRESELAELAAETAARPGAQANPRPASAEDVEALLRSVW
ncbi:MAG: iron-containing alcohol dehydrogenase [Gaiellaceae bacterium]